VDEFRGRESRGFRGSVRAGDQGSGLGFRVYGVGRREDYCSRKEERGQGHGEAIRHWFHDRVGSIATMTIISMEEARERYINESDEGV
jgi:hypothetical protein